MTIVAIHQPDFLPYIGFFSKMQMADLFILYDTAQFSKNGFHNRNRIKSPRGAEWITIPVKSPGFRRIMDVEIDDRQHWQTRLWQTIEANYRRAPFFTAYEPGLREAVTGRGRKTLAQLNTELVDLIAHFLEIHTKKIRASELTPLTSTDRTDKLVEMTKLVGGSVYLSGAGGYEYLNLRRFADVRLSVMRKPQITYHQLWGGFVPWLSIIDVLFNVGDGARQLVIQCSEADFM